ncbi:hypothetical protein C6P46_005605 [Rhodotorula mucilaginosa]|uniref:Uncharacterized protein n=1 Tax=Rhodotorula mucilaginosa TaxID=5537 RepID=A0A9P6VYU6_RHOMI|nr:hypothetical protein C6P46_005605 [Rhodotorula mucilaginosa]
MTAIGPTAGSSVRRLPEQNAGRAAPTPHKASWRAPMPKNIDKKQDKLVQDVRKTCERLKLSLNGCLPWLRADSKRQCSQGRRTRPPGSRRRAWQLTEAVDRDNLGYIPNSIEISGAKWADPTREDGLVEAALDEEPPFQRSSLEEMAQTNSLATRSISAEGTRLKRMRDEATLLTGK